MPYLFVHFKEKTTPDGEQVYFGLSRDGFHWEMVNQGQPVLWAYYGDKGVRDHTIVRTDEGRFHILATDLSLSYGMRNQYHRSWQAVAEHGSKHLAIWSSDDLIHWSEHRLICLDNMTNGQHFGCLWAPDVIRDRATGDYILHWSSSVDADGYATKAIYYSRTRDFETFTPPQVLHADPGHRVIDSAMYYEDGAYYLFVKNETNTRHIQLLRSDSVTGPFALMPQFDAEMAKLEANKYEAPTCLRIADGRVCLFLDYYGVPGEGQGYVPFIANSLKEGVFLRSDADFSFPYGFKHGTILEITDEEYDRIRDHAKW